MNAVSYRNDGAKKPLLSDINVSFERCRVYSVIGKPGPEKSALLSLLAGVDVCTNGEILYEGKSLKQMDRDEYRAKKIGVVFPGCNLLVNSTPLENIVLAKNIGGSADKNKKQTAYDLLEGMGINRAAANRKIEKLSDAERQRVRIARAISYNPAIIIADEPASGLDRDTAEEISDILASLAHREGKCVIITASAKKDVSVADEIWGITAGRLLFIK